MNTKVIASLFFAGIMTTIAGCDDASKGNDTVKQAEEKAQQLKEDGQQKANELSEDVKNKTEELKQNTAEFGKKSKQMLSIKRMKWYQM